MFDLLLARHSEFTLIWQQFSRTWQHTAELPLSLALTDLAAYIPRLIRIGEHAELVHIFEVIELWLTTGNADVQRLTLIALLRYLQQVNCFDQYLLEQVNRMLLPTTRQRCTEYLICWDYLPILSAS